MIALFYFIGGYMEEMKNKEKTDTKQVGNLTELQCITRLYELGHSISIPYGDSEKYDFILDVNGNLYKIQCKHADVHKNEDGEDDYILLNTSWMSGYTKGNDWERHIYTKNEIDYFATFYNGKSYLIPVEECNTQKLLRILPSKNNQIKGINYLTNYLDEKVCWDLL